MVIQDNDALIRICNTQAIKSSVRANVKLSDWFYQWIIHKALCCSFFSKLFELFVIWFIPASSLLLFIIQFKIEHSDVY